MSDALIGEAKLAEKLGVSRDVLAQVRANALTPEEDWQTYRNAIVFTPLGEKKARAALGLDQPAEPETPDSEAPDAEPEPPEPQTLFVKRRALHNPRLIFATAEKKAAAPELPVRVRDSRFFVPGQEILATRGEGELWHLAGRQPRTPWHSRQAPPFSAPPSPMIVDPDLPRHRKTLKLASRLGMPVGGVLELLINLWGHCQTRRDPFLGTDAEDVAACCQCLSVPAKKLHTALREVGWIDATPAGFEAHGWLERNAPWINKIAGGKSRANAPRDEKGRLLPATRTNGQHAPHLPADASPPPAQLAGPASPPSRPDAGPPAPSLAGAVEWSGVEEPLSSPVGDSAKDFCSLEALADEATARLCQIFGRQKKWMGHEARTALENMAVAGVLPLPVADWQALEAFYRQRSEHPGEKMWRNSAEAVAKDLPGEVEKARRWLSEHGGPEPAKNLPTVPDPAGWSEWLAASGYPSLAFAEADGSLRREFREKSAHPAVAV